MVGCGCDAIVQVPTARWDVRAQPALPEPLASRVRHAGFVKGAEREDIVALLAAARRLRSKASSAPSDTLEGGIDQQAKLSTALRSVLKK